MVIFAIAALVAPYFKSWWKVLPWALGAQSACHVCTSVRTSLDVIAGAGVGLFIGGVLNLVFGVPSASSSTARAGGLRSVRLHGSPRPRGCGFAVNMRGPAFPQSGVPEQPEYFHGRSVARPHRFACSAHGGALHSDALADWPDLAAVDAIIRAWRATAHHGRTSRSGA